MHRLMPGSLIIDLADGSIHGDLDHCSKEDLLESARALLSILPQVRHKGLWGLGKAYDADCYIHTRQSRYQVPEVSLEVGWPTHRAFHLLVLHGNRQDYWKGDWYSKPVGAIKDGEVVDSTEGLPDHYMPPPEPTIPTPPGKVHTAKPSSRVQRPRLL